MNGTNMNMNMNGSGMNGSTSNNNNSDDSNTNDGQNIGDLFVNGINMDQQKGDNIDIKGNVTNTKDVKKTILDLEILKQLYNKVLLEYNQTEKDYIQLTEVEMHRPCGKYNSNSLSIDQDCYADIWKKAGCTTTPSQVNTWDSWSSYWSLNNLIQNSWQWATGKDSNSRTVCYGSYSVPYYIIGVGTDYNLYAIDVDSKQYTPISDNTNALYNGAMFSIGRGYLDENNNPIVLVANGGDAYIYTKANYTDSTWTGPHTDTCCVICVVQAPDGTIIGIGGDSALWSKDNFNSGWVRTASTGEYCKSVCLGPDGSIYVIGSDNCIYKKNSYKDLPSQAWSKLTTAQQFSSFGAITDDGVCYAVGMDQKIYTYSDYTTISTDTAWTNIDLGGGIFTSIAIVNNPNYNDASYNNASEPNYNINAPILGGLKGRTFWGASGITEDDNMTSIDDCKALCSSNANCSGATFNPDKKTCWIRSGEGTVGSGLDTDYAIIPIEKMLLDKLDKLNSQLTTINNQMLDITSNKATPEYKQMTSTSIMGTNEIQQNYKELSKKRQNIDDMLKEFKQLDEEKQEGDVKTDQKYYYYLLLIVCGILIAVFLFTILSKSNKSDSSSSSSGQSGGGSKLKNNTFTFYFLIVVFLGIVVFNSIYKEKQLQNK